MRLSEQQLKFFDTFGFLKFPGLFAAEIVRITEAFERIWAEHGGGHHGKPHDYQRRSALVLFADQDEYLCGLLDDPRIDGGIDSLLGDDYNYMGSDGNYYVGDTAWHSDGYFKDPKYTSVKMALYLDQVTRDTGCLRVIPGSHKLGDKYALALQDCWESSKENRTEELWGVHGSEVPAVALETVPGDLLMFNHRIKHSSWGGSDRRRMFTMNFQQQLREEDLDQLRNDVATKARFWVDMPYGDTLVRTAGPERMVHLEQRLANADHLPALAFDGPRGDWTSPAGAEATEAGGYACCT